MKPVPSNRAMGDESRLAQIRYWQSIGGYGISPEMLTLTGFWSNATLRQLQEQNVDTSQSIEQIFGGVIRFQPLPGKKWEARYDKIIDALNMILQVKRHIKTVIETIPLILNEKYNEDDLEVLPSDLDEDIKRMIVRPTTYVVAEDPYIARQLLSALSLLKSLQNTPSYYSGIYREANTIFSRMVLESVSLSMRNLSLRDNQQQTVSLESLADEATKHIMEDE